MTRRRLFATRPVLPADLEPAWWAFLDCCDVLEGAARESRAACTRRCEVHASLLQRRPLRPGQGWRTHVLAVRSERSSGEAVVRFQS